MNRPRVGGAMLALALTVGPAAAASAGQTLAVPRASAGTYRVKVGDTLSALAVRLGASQAQLAAANSIADPNLILAGQTLVVAGRLPPPGPVSRPPRQSVATVDLPRRCPVPAAHFVDDFGYVRPDNGHRHEGVDLFAPRGTPVVAPVAGTVALDPNHLGGKAVVLWGVDGIRYYGAHLDSYGRTGPVAAGTVIGRVGNTGDAVGGPTHLHFEVHPGGGPAVSPYPLLVRSCR